MAIASTSKNQRSTLTLNGLQLFVFLGIYPEEKIKPQRVSIDIKIRFPKLPKACLTDQLIDTYCYHQLVDFLKKNTEKRRFQLIEHLASELQALLKGYFQEKPKISLRLTKKPPIPDLIEGVTFELSDI